MTRDDREFLLQASEWKGDPTQPVSKADFARLAHILREFIGEVEEQHSYEDEVRRGEDN